MQKSRKARHSTGSKRTVKEEKKDTVKVIKPMAKLNLFSDDRTAVNGLIRALDSQLKNTNFHLSKKADFGVNSKVPNQRPRHSVVVWKFAKGEIRDAIRSLKGNLHSVSRVITIGENPNKF